MSGVLISEYFPLLALFKPNSSFLEPLMILQQSRFNLEILGMQQRNTKHLFVLKLGA